MDSRNQAEQPNISLLIISHDVVGKAMAGPGIRYLQIAQCMAPHTRATLAIPAESPKEAEALADGELFDIVRYSRGEWATLAPAYEATDLCLLPSEMAHEFPHIGQGRRSDGQRESGHVSEGIPNVPELDETIIIVDCYNPLMAEWLAQCDTLEEETVQPFFEHRHRALQTPFEIGDFFVCASERQRDWLLGQLEAHGRINPSTYRADPSLRSLVDVVPYGLPDNVMPDHSPIVKGVWEGISIEDPLILWGGGLWHWLDPLTAIRAMPAVIREHPTARLIFPGTEHPNPNVAAGQTRTATAKALAEELGLMESHVFFGGWIPYERWPDILHESDVALSLHFSSFETHLAFRSRILEYIWAGISTIATEGDVMSDMIEKWGIGVVVGVKDVDGVAEGICSLLVRSKSLDRTEFSTARQALNWPTAVEPLIQFCKQKQPAMDRYIAVNQVQQGVDKANETERLKAENDALNAILEGYKNGRVIKVLGWLDRLRRNL